MVISWANGKLVGSWQLLLVIPEVMNFVRIVQAVLVHIPCSQNDVADKLAKMGGWAVG